MKDSAIPFVLTLAVLAGGAYWYMNKKETHEIAASDVLPIPRNLRPPPPPPQVPVMPMTSLMDGIIARHNGGA